MPSKGSWRWGVVDGEHFMRDRGERITDDHSGRGRDRRDEDDDHDGRGRDSFRGWRNTISRSLSRAGRRDDGRSRNDHSRERD